MRNALKRLHQEPCGSGNLVNESGYLLLHVALQKWRAKYGLDTVPSVQELSYPAVKMSKAYGHKNAVGGGGGQELIFFFN